MGSLGNQCFCDNLLQLIFININLVPIVQFIIFMHISIGIVKLTSICYFTTDRSTSFGTLLMLAILLYILFCIAYDIAYTDQRFAI